MDRLVDPDARDGPQPVVVDVHVHPGAGAQALTAARRRVIDDTVGRLLRELGYRYSQVQDLGGHLAH